MVLNDFRWVKDKLTSSEPEVQLKACEQRAILESLANLMTFSCVRTGVEARKLSLHGWYFDITEGQLLCFNFRTGAFEVLDN